jgi:hypothetical protein
MASTVPDLELGIEQAGEPVTDRLAPGPVTPLLEGDAPRPQPIARSSIVLGPPNAAQG